MTTLDCKRPENLAMNFGWSRNLRALFDQSDVRKAVDDLSLKWLDFARFIKEENETSDLQFAKEEFKLNTHVFPVRVFDGYWLTEHFDAFDLAEIQLAVCRGLEPRRQWEIVENDLHSVIADADRTLVADLKLERRLSAAASLLFAGDGKMTGVLGVEQELNRYLEEQIQTRQRAIEGMEKHLVELNQRADVIPFHSGD